jgi:hypothetical protein
MEKRCRVSELTVRHELDVMAVKAAIVPAVTATAGFTIEEFSTWPLLYQFETRRPNGDPLVGENVLVKPDGFIRIREKAADNACFEHTFFLEVDRSTEVQETLALRAACYMDYYRRGGLAVRYGRPRSEYKDFPFRVLMVFKNAERRNNFADRMLRNNPPILTQVWFTTFEEVTADPLGSIWVRPMDYGEATRGTSFSPDGRRPDPIYRRQPEREKLVDKTITKHRLPENNSDIP